MCLLMHTLSESHTRSRQSLGRRVKLTNCRRLAGCVSLFIFYASLLCREQVNELKIDVIVRPACNFGVFTDTRVNTCTRVSVHPGKRYEV